MFLLFYLGVYSIKVLHIAHNNKEIGSNPVKPKKYGYLFTYWS